MYRRFVVVIAPLVVLSAVYACTRMSAGGVSQDGTVRSQGSTSAGEVARAGTVDEGKAIFRDDTFGDEYFWSDTLELHRAIAGDKHGGVGAGLTPRQALAAGLKVDMERLDRATIEAIRGGKANLDDPATTLALLKAGAVVGVKGFYNGAGMDPTRVGITCAICHSTVNDGLTKGIGSRLDGWPNRDLNIGAVVAMAPKLTPFENALQMDAEAIRKVLKSWGPGRYDAELIHDGKAFRPDGKTAATLLPAAFGLAGINLHTYTGWGSVTH